jgi:hypothetical protein
MLAMAGRDMPETRPVRRELVRRVIALDPLIDTVKGESSQLRYHSPVLQKAVDGLFAAFVGWRIIAVLLARLPDDEAHQGANAILRNLPRELRAAAQGVPAEWMADPAHVRDTCRRSPLYRLPHLRSGCSQTKQRGCLMAFPMHSMALRSLPPVSRFLLLGAAEFRFACPIGSLPSLMQAARSS